jgi:hypothetical protein
VRSFSSNSCSGDGRDVSDETPGFAVRNRTTRAALEHARSIVDLLSRDLALTERIELRYYMTAVLFLLSGYVG